jgi:hypothetical protein
MFEYQNTVYNCLSNLLGYNPTKIINYTIHDGTPCDSDFCSFGGGFISEWVPYYVIDNYGGNGIAQRGDIRVINTTFVRADIHETTHAFTFFTLGSSCLSSFCYPIAPPWFNEGVSIYAENRISCHPLQWNENNSAPGWVPGWAGRYEYYQTPIEYNKLKSGETSINLSETGYWYKQGLYFFYGLEKDYGCDSKCVETTLKDLHNYQQNYGFNFTTGSCSGYLCWNEYGNNYVIKNEFEKTLNANLSSFFNMLNIPFTCIPNWILNDTWSGCVNDNQYKNYHDVNFCGAQPPIPLSQSCSVGTTTTSTTSTSTSTTTVPTTTTTVPTTTTSTTITTTSTTSTTIPQCSPCTLACAMSLNGCQKNGYYRQYWCSGYSLKYTESCTNYCCNFIGGNCNNGVCIGTSTTTTLTTTSTTIPGSTTTTTTLPTTTTTIPGGTILYQVSSGCNLYSDLSCPPFGYSRCEVQLDSAPCSYCNCPTTVTLQPGRNYKFTTFCPYTTLSSIGCKMTGFV